MIKKIWVDLNGICILKKDLNLVVGKKLDIGSILVGNLIVDKNLPDSCELFFPDENEGIYTSKVLYPEEIKGISLILSTLSYRYSLISLYYEEDILNFEVRRPFYTPSNSFLSEFEDESLGILITGRKSNLEV